LNEFLEDGSIGFLPLAPLPNNDKHFPYFLLRDDAFGLRTYLTKPNSSHNLTREEMIVSYRISRDTN